jgi:hypothetical protein
MQGSALANQKKIQEQMSKKAHNPQGSNAGTTLRTRALGFSVFLSSIRG